jgi:hypothetical protein
MGDLACSLMQVRRHQPAEDLLKQVLMIQMKAGFDRHHPNIVNTKMGLYFAKTKTAVPNALKLPKPYTRCPCGSGEQYRGCCY